MPKRNSTAEIFDNLSEKEKLAQSAKAEALRMIPDPEFVGSIDFESTYTEIDFNVRDPEEYAYERNVPLYNSLNLNGLERRGDTMVFSRKSDGRLKVLVGNLRHTMMRLIRKNKLADAMEKKETIDASALPFATIFGLVYTGLTESQETALMADHVMRKGLNEFELAKEVAELVRATGMTIAKASVHFGMDDNAIRRICMRYAMPTIFAEYRKEMSGDKNIPCIKVGNEHLDALYSAYLIDQEAGCKYREEGDSFRKVWADIQTNPDSHKRSVKAKEKAKANATKEKATIITQVKSLPARYGTGLEIEKLATALNWASGDDEARLDVAAKELQTYCDSLRSEREKLAESLIVASDEKATLIAERDALVAERDALVAERDALVAERDALVAERDSIRNGRRKASR